MRSGWLNWKASETISRYFGTCAVCCRGAWVVVDVVKVAVGVWIAVGVI